ncbi:hypothetical protein JYU34_004488 [Plutella xylostella]|uniref:Gustatory receptor n=1 Tax=Plutella xylostella TaxID=51655 RepID=A0ABQ7QY51_PLUXY|nr:hypothetical protein JYU34_004488 [Plutella xylostella]
MQVHRGVYWLLASVGYSVVECAAGLMFVDDSWDAIIIVLYLAMSAHDTEQIFLCILLKSIYIRLRIIKAHARKVSDITEHKEEVEKELSEVPECLAKKSYLSLTFLIVVYTMVRCTKYTGLVVVACYYCNMTLEQVVAIRTVLHDAINLGNEERMKRRQLKAFLQMARDNEFTYSLCGVIGMDMSLPLNYISICTTYLVIIIQFSKFID